MRCVSNLPSPPDWVRHEAWLLQSVMYALHAHNCCTACHPCRSGFVYRRRQAMRMTASALRAASTS